MKRNQREEYLKHIRRLIDLRDDLREEAHKVEYVPLEKPVFAGWNVSLDLSQSGKRRRDAPELTAIIHLLNINKPVFIRHITWIKVIRKNRYKYHTVTVSKDCKEFMAHFLTKWVPHNKQDWYPPYKITSQVYKELPKWAKPYFEPSVRHLYNGMTIVDYYLSDRFPFYELEFRPTKSYYKSLGVPNGDAQSDYHKVNQYLDNRYGDCLRSQSESNYRNHSREWNKGIYGKRAAQRYCSEVKKYYNCDPGGFGEDDYMQNVLLKKLCNMKLDLTI